MRQQLMTRLAPEAAGRARHASSARHLVLRAVTAAAVLLSAGVHLVLYFDGFSEIPVIGPLFMLNAVGGIVIAAAVLVWRHWLPVLGAVGFGALTLAAFLMSLTVGLLGVHETTWNTPEVLAMIGDVVALVGGLVLLVRPRERRR
ncbi:MAG TPA: hypothetical protein VF053_14440 [Streptosporangiales bacterium]